MIVEELTDHAVIQSSKSTPYEFREGLEMRVQGDYVKCGQAIKKIP